MRVLVCGGRGYDNYTQFCLEMDKLSTEYDFDRNQPITIISGKAKGADTCAEIYAYECDWNFEGYPADWNTYGKSAGYIRNKQMLTEGKPDLVVAFPGGKGTKNMVDLANEAKVSVVIINESIG